MADTALSFGKSDIHAVGKLYIEQHPAQAKELLEEYKAQKQKALDTDETNAIEYFLIFCDQYSIPWHQLRKEQHKTNRVDNRRLLICALIRIYRPQILFAPVCVENGTGELLRRLFGLNPGYMSRIIDEVKAWYTDNRYGFQEKVDEVVESLINAQKGYGVPLFKNVA